MSAATTGAQRTQRGGARTAPIDHTTIVGAVMRTLAGAHRDELWHWMPHVARPIDVIVGAILVQHTTWTNAERALESLRAAGALFSATWRASSQAAEAFRIRATPLVARRCAFFGEISASQLPMSSGIPSPS